MSKLPDVPEQWKAAERVSAEVERQPDVFLLGI